MKSLIVTHFLFSSLMLLHCGRSNGRKHSYVVVPMNLNFFGGLQFMHFYITGNQDTSLNITIPDSRFSESVRLTSENDWTWKKEYTLDPGLINDALDKGFRFDSSESVNIYVTRNHSGSYSLTSFLALPITPDSTSFLLNPYQRTRTLFWFDVLYAIAAGDQETTVQLTKYNESTGSPERIGRITLKPFEVYYNTTNSAESDYTIGMEVNASEPVAVFTGNERTFIPMGYAQYIAAYTQVPDVSSFQDVFVLGPLRAAGVYLERTGFTALVIFAHENTETTVVHDVGKTITVRRSSHWCTCYKSFGQCKISCSKPINKGAYVEFMTNDASSPIIVTCSKPCFTTIVKHSQTTYGARPQGYLAPIGSPKKRMSTLRTFVPLIGEDYTLQETYINVVVPRGKMAGVLVDGSDTWRKNRDVSVATLEDWAVLTIPVSPGVHTIQHKSEVIPIAAHVYGTSHKLLCTYCYSSSFGFPAVFQVTDEIGPNTDEAATTYSTTQRLSPTQLPVNGSTISPDCKDTKQIKDPDVILYALVTLILAGIVALFFLNVLCHCKLQKTLSQKARDGRQGNEADQMRSSRLAMANKRQTMDITDDDMRYVNRPNLPKRPQATHTTAGPNRDSVQTTYEMVN